MASLKEIRGRLVSIKGTLKITSAMRLISAAKMRSAQNAIGNMDPYRKGLQDIMLSLPRSGACEKIIKPYVTEGKGGGTAVLLVTSNQSLCGSFNVNLVKAFERMELTKDNTTVYAIGRYGFRHLQREGYVCVDLCHLSAHADYDSSVALSKELVEGFRSGRFSKVLMLYPHFKNAVSQPVTLENYLPMDAGALEASSDEDLEYIVEPSPEHMLETLLPMVLRLTLHTMLLDSTVAEHAARSMAMQTASENAEDLIQELSLQYNKLRQQAITSEILDLLGGQTNNN